MKRLSTLFVVFVALAASTSQAEQSEQSEFIETPHGTVERISLPDGPYDESPRYRANGLFHRSLQRAERHLMRLSIPIRPRLAEYYFDEPVAQPTGFFSRWHRCRGFGLLFGRERFTP